MERRRKGYKLIARSPYGLLMQILSDLITYLLPAIDCHDEHGERVDIERIREMRNAIRNEAVQAAAAGVMPTDFVDLAFGADATPYPDTAGDKWNNSPENPNSEIPVGCVCLLKMAVYGTLLRMTSRQRSKLTRFAKDITAATMSRGQV